MRYRRALKFVLWSSGVLLTLLLLFWLTVAIFDSTELTVNLKNQEAAAETTLGNLKCHKTVSADFPFVTLRCRKVQEKLE